MHIDHNNKKWLYQHLQTNEEVEEVAEYLKNNNLTIKVTKTHDPQSGWNGAHVQLQGRDLSINGFCFSGKQLLNHVRNFQKYSLIEQSNEYQQYLSQKDQFEEIEKFFKQ